MKDKYPENLISVLKKMGKDELDKFELFLKSPYYNTRTKLVSVFLCLKKFSPSFDPEKYSKMKVFIELNEHKVYNPGVINEEYSALYRLSLKFLKLRQSEKKDVSLKISLLDTLREKHLDSSFEKLSKEVDSMLSNIPDNRNNLIDQYDSILAKYNYCVSQVAKTKAKYSEEELQLAGSAFRKLVLFFITNSTALLVNSFVISNSYNKKILDEYGLIFKNGILNQLLTALKWDKKEKVLVSLYKKFYTLIQNPYDKRIFDQYHMNINKNVHLLDKTELLFHFHFLISLYRKFYKKSKDIEYRFRILALRETILFEGLYISDFNREYLHLDFRNIVLETVNLQLYERLNNLIPYVDKLPEKYQATFLNYVKANYHFLRNEFDKALHFALGVTTVEKKLLIDMDVMKIKIYFLNREFIRCVDKINTLKKYMNELTEMNIESINRYKEFLKTIHKSILLIENNDLVGLNVMQQSVLHTGNMVFKEWYVNCISGLMRNTKLLRKKSASISV